MGRRLFGALAQSVGAWVDYNLDITTSFNPESQQMIALENELQEKDEILEEIAGLLKDILQELDVRLEENGTWTMKRQKLLAWRYSNLLDMSYL